ncbi:MAG: hypothetical protein ACRBB3_02435 [Alphaproteobacteria bacterium]
MNKLLCVSLLALIFSAPSMAQDEANTSTTQTNAQVKLETPKYSPNYCQFTANFPDEPYKTQRCEGDTMDTCFDLISYTKVFDLSTSITVEIICNPSTPKMYEEFTPQVMEKTVRAMTEDSVIEAYEIKGTQEKEYRQTGLLGRGRKGVSDTIYIAQLWIADNSIMSVEAELIGEQSDESDAVFAQILRGIGYTKDIEKAEIIRQTIEKQPSENQQTK